jgi:tetratricopeptide (TPR) repeat protein
MASEHGPFFRRAVPPPDAESQIATLRHALAEARKGADARALMEALGHLAFVLTMAELEAEAAPLAEEALALSRQIGDRGGEIDGLLQLGTTRQYLGERQLAARLFHEGLALVAATGLRAQENFLQHHLGRCLVELGRIDDARAAFEAALALRKALGERRFIESTEAALKEIAGRPS